ncbi:MAG: PepSY domain-containing protein, partial [Pseudomonas amygdali]
MKSQTVRRWSIVHTWSSLICTLFLLMLAVTGLPLIFHHEIDHLLGDAPQYQEMPADTPHLNLEQLARAAEAHRPGEVMQYFGWDDEDPNGVMAITAATAGTEPNSSHTFALDARTGEALEMPSANGGFMMVMLRLHVDMYANLPGKLLLAFMGLLFVVAIVSGTVLYAPFMRKLEFGQVRVNKSRRTRWLDLHNLIGVVTLTWALVVGVTGVISACADLLIASWRNDALATMIAPYKDAPPLTQRAPATRLLEIAESAAPGMQADFIAFPGTRFSSEHHYAVFLKG